MTIGEIFSSSAVYPEIAKLSNDELRAKTVELKKYISDSAAEEQKKIEELKGTIETTELEDREGIFAQIDKLEKEVLEKYEKALDECTSAGFCHCKSTLHAVFLKIRNWL